MESCRRFSTSLPHQRVDATTRRKLQTSPQFFSILGLPRPEPLARDLFRGAPLRVATMYFDGASSPVQGSPSSPSLFSQYASPDGRPRRRGNATTRSAQLRANGVRLHCYLNCEGAPSLVGGGRQSTIVKLPDECDTIDEVLIKIQARMHLDARMLYASELYDVHGTPIRTMSQLTKLAVVDSPIMVGCGEPFDASRIPPDLLKIHDQGGGRKGAQKVQDDLRQKRMATQRQKAEKVREAGHGMSSEAVILARTQNIATNRAHVEEMRHKYMESILLRAAQQEDLMQSVKSNMAMHKMEAAESKVRPIRIASAFHRRRVQRRARRTLMPCATHARAHARGLAGAYRGEPPTEAAAAAG